MKYNQNLSKILCQQFDIFYSSDNGSTADTTLSSPFMKV